MSDKGIVEGLRLVAPLIQASMEESRSITDSLMKSNVKTSYTDGFEAGLREGMKRQLMYTRHFLGIWQEEPNELDAGFYLEQEIKRPGKYPYSLLAENS